MAPLVTELLGQFWAKACLAGSSPFVCLGHPCQGLPGFARPQQELAPRLWERRVMEKRCDEV
eukprot:11227573-Lingulodinium_polyedra.AAC.1